MKYTSMKESIRKEGRKNERKHEESLVNKQTKNLYSAKTNK